MLPASNQTIENRQHFLQQDGRPVFKFAVSYMSEVITKLLKRNSLEKNEIDYVVPHQANKRILDAIARNLDLAPGKMLTNIEKYGNTTAATLPLLLWDNRKNFKKNEKLIFTAFGAGFTWGASYLTWAYNS